MRFLLTGRDTNGELLRIDMRVRPGGFASGEHIHPHQEEQFAIERGEITLRLRGQEHRYRAGERVTIPPGTPHVWWNSGTDELHVLIEFRPAGRFAEFITTYFALARLGRVNDRGVPTNLLQLVATFAEYQDVLTGTSPPLALQRILFATLGPLARVLGYSPDVAYE